MKELIKTKPSEWSQPKILNINKKLTTNNHAIAEEFNTFFNAIAGKIDEKLIPASYQYQTALNEPNQNTMTLLPTTEDEIKSIIKELKANKTTGPNSIPIKILQNNKNELAKPLCDLISLVFQTGTFLDILKTAKNYSNLQKGRPFRMQQLSTYFITIKYRKINRKTHPC